MRSLLGEGVSGRVYEAIHCKTHARCAIKLLRSDADERARARMLREARALAKLDHPHIVRMLDYDETSDGSVLIVQELLEGETLRARLDHALVLGAHDALALLLPVLDALAYAHDRGVIHRDLKPENIVLCVDRHGRTTAKLLDFGLSRDDHDRSNITRAGTIAGTPRYMSPEQAWGRADLDARTDVWSFAVVLYECCSGVVPYDGANDREVLASIVAHDPPHLRSTAVAVDEAIADAVMLGLVRAPEARVPSAAEFARALRRAIDGTQPEPPSPATSAARSSSSPAVTRESMDLVPPSVARPATQRAWRALAAVAIGALGIATLLALRSSPTSPARARAEAPPSARADAQPWSLDARAAADDAASPDAANAMTIAPLDALALPVDATTSEPRLRRTGAIPARSRYDAGQEAGRSAPRRGANAAPIVDEL